MDFENRYVWLAPKEPDYHRIREQIIYEHKRLIEDLIIKKIPFQSIWYEIERFHNELSQHERKGE